MHQPEPPSETALQDFESSVPALAARAGHDAHLRALRDTGSVVMKSASGDLVERRRDGTERFLKALPAATPVRAGEVLRRVRPAEPLTDS